MTTATLNSPVATESTSVRFSNGQANVLGMVITPMALTPQVSTTLAPQYRISRFPATGSPTTESLFTAPLPGGLKFVHQANTGLSAYIAEAMTDLLYLKEEAEEEGWQVLSADNMKMAERVFISRDPATNSPTEESPHTAPLPGGLKFVRQVNTGLSVYIEEAMTDLLCVKEEAEEEGWSPPSADTMKMAERVFGDMFSYAPRPYAIYAMPDGEIAIDAHSPHGTKVLVICDAKGGARCLTYLNGDFDSREHEDARALPDDFVRDALRKTESHQ